MLTDITVYNRYYNEESGVDKYARTVIPNVWWFCRTKSTVTTDGLQSADELTLRVAANSIPGKEYADSGAFTGQDGYFTFAQGDLVVMGRNETEIAKASDVAGAFTIIGVTDNRVGGNMPHWRITAK